VSGKTKWRSTEDCKTIDKLPDGRPFSLVALLVLTLKRADTFLVQEPYDSPSQYQNNI
jgi:hypothetical protein